MKSLVSIFSLLLSVLFTYVCGDKKFLTNDVAVVTCPSGSNCTVPVTLFGIINLPGNGAVLTDDYIVFGRSGEMALGDCISSPCVIKCNDDCVCLQGCNSSSNITAWGQDNDVGVDDMTPIEEDSSQHNVSIMTNNDTAVVTCPSSSSCTVPVALFGFINQPAVTTNYDYVHFDSAGELTLGGCISAPCMFECNENCTCLQGCNSSSNVTAGGQDNGVGVDDMTPIREGSSPRNVAMMTNHTAIVTCPGGSSCTVQMALFGGAISQPATLANDYVIFGSTGELTLGDCMSPPCVIKCNDDCTCLQGCNSSTNITAVKKDDDDENHHNTSMTSAGESMQLVAGIWGGINALIAYFCLVVLA